MTVCTAHIYKTGKACTREAINGTAVCELHGGTAPQTVRKAESDRVSRELDGFIEPIRLDDPEARPDYGLHMEYRRSVARVRWLEQRIADTIDADGLEWGKSKEERIGATEFAGTNTTYEARTPVLVDLLARERAHLLKITELMSKNAFKEAHLAVLQTSVNYIGDAALDLAEALGRKRDDPRVLRALTRYLTEHPPPELTT